MKQLFKSLAMFTAISAMTTACSQSDAPNNDNETVGNNLEDTHTPSEQHRTSYMPEFDKAKRGECSDLKPRENLLFCADVFELNGKIFLAKEECRGDIDISTEAGAQHYLSCEKKVEQQAEQYFIKNIKPLAPAH